MTFKIFHQGTRTRRVGFSRNAKGTWVSTNGTATFLEKVEREAPTAQVTSNIRAPMTGKIVQLLVEPHAQVEEKQLLIILEAMKMEYRLFAPRRGVIGGIHCKVGDLVDLGQELVSLKP